MRLRASIHLALAVSLPALAGECSVAGSRVQWQADYCMFRVGSDDIVAADPCIRADGKRRYASDCEAKKYYKREICRMTISSDPDATGQTVEQCLKDKSFMGPTVRNGGVGG